jgi:uncharacterized alpha-E superfamily protein
MLSRIAESLFWIGRYVERADGTARIVDVVRMALLEDPVQADESSLHMVLSMIMGDAAPEGEVGFAEVRDRLVFDATNPSSIAGAWYAARENARRARELLSLELWEAINTAWHGWQRLGTPDATAKHIAWSRARAALIAGIADSTLSHDEAWDFLMLGRALERADMTARIVATGTLPIGGLSWPAVLLSCGGQQAYLRTNRGMATDRRSAAFLVLDKEFPRSVLFSLAEAEACLRRLSPGTDRLGVSDEARRTLGLARTHLEYRLVEEVTANLPLEMVQVQRAVGEAAAAVARRYFPSGPLPMWSEEML